MTDTMPNNDDPAVVLSAVWDWVTDMLSDGGRLNLDDPRDWGPDARQTDFPFYQGLKGRVERALATLHEPEPAEPEEEEVEEPEPEEKPAPRTKARQ